MAENEKGTDYLSWAMLGCGCFAALVVIIGAVFIVIYGKANLWAAPKFNSASLTSSTPTGEGQNSQNQTGGTGNAAGKTCNGYESPIKEGFDHYGPYTINGLNDTGLDLHAVRGSTVYAAKGGTILYSDDKGYVDPDWVGPINDRGQIKIDHGDGTYTAYRHLSARTIQSGTVTAGQPIGSSGTANGAPHLHYEILKGSGDNVTAYMNPYYMANCYSGSSQWGSPAEWGYDYYEKP